MEGDGEGEKQLDDEGQLKSFLKCDIFSLKHMTGYHLEFKKTSPAGQLDAPSASL